MVQRFVKIAFVKCCIKAALFLCSLFSNMFPITLTIGQINKHSPNATGWADFAMQGQDGMLNKAMFWKHHRAKAFSLVSRKFGLLKVVSAYLARIREGI